MKNLLNTMPIATIYLDNQLRIKRFTPAATSIFNLISTDVDRPISHITSQIGDYDIDGDARKVLDTLIPADRTIRSRDGKWFLARIMPYHTSDNAIAGVVVTFVDATERQKSEETLARATDQIARLADVLDSISDALFVIDRDWRYIYVNSQGLAFSRRPKEEVLGATVWDVFPDVKGSELETCLRRAMKESKRDTCEFRYNSLAKGAEHHLYPTKDGLLEFVSEIAETRKMKPSEGLAKA